MTETIQSVGFKPLANKILIKKLDTGDTTVSGIYVGEVEGVDKAEVVAIGPQALHVVIGDVVMADWSTTKPIILGEDTFYITVDSLIIGIFDETALADKSKIKLTK